MTWLLKLIYAWRYRRYWRRWKGDHGGPFEPSPFFNESDAYLISKAIRDGEEKP